MQDRKYDIILWGATGHAGRPAAKYFHAHYASKGLIRWAIAGRDRAKLEAVKAEIGDPNLDIFIVPGADLEAARSIASQTKVVAATIAPGALYATEMVIACIENGTHLCDLCGELHWLRRMIDTYDDKAKAANVKIVNCCGLDSIPSDVMVQLVQREAKEKHGEYCQHITNCFGLGNIQVSGGSFASGKGVMQTIADDAEMADMIANPYSLNPRDQLHGPHCPDLDKVVYDPDFAQNLMPFPFGQINARLVRRTHALLGNPWGSDFTYLEARLAGNGLLKKWAAQLEAYFTNLFVAADPNSGFGKFLHSLGPKPGDGPSDEKIAKSGPTSFACVGTTRSGKKVQGWMYTEWDPGHGGTAAMLCDSAYCLARREAEIEKATGNTGGFLTPWLAMGDVLRDQLGREARVFWGTGSLSKP